jgi:hypothetical protein
MYDLGDIWVSFRGKFQVVEINSDAQTVYSFYKYMRKIRARGIQELERRILILSLLYIIDFVNFLFLFKWSNRWLESLGDWTNIFKEEYGIPGCLMAFVL